MAAVNVFPALAKVAIIAPCKMSKVSMFVLSKVSKVMKGVLNGVAC